MTHESFHESFYERVFIREISGENNCFLWDYELSY
jgi:hypothetical protein